MQIIFVRHAQTAGKQAGQRDFDRLLTAEGEHQAKNIGNFFVRNSVHPDYLLSSTAIRARRTAELINEMCAITMSKMDFRDDLYEAETATWISAVQELPAAVQCVLCIGHNPVLSVVASHLAGRNIDLAPAAFIRFTSTSGDWKSFRNQIKEIES